MKNFGSHSRLTAQAFAAERSNSGSSSVNASLLDASLIEDEVTRACLEVRLLVDPNALSVRLKIHDFPPTRFVVISLAQPSLLGDHARVGNAEQLARAFFLVGHVAVRLLVLLEQAEADIKRLRAAKSDKKSTWAGVQASAGLGYVGKG